MSEDKKKGSQQPELRIVDEIERSGEVTRLHGSNAEGNAPRKKANLRRSQEKQALAKDLKISDALPDSSREIPEAQVAESSQTTPFRIPPAFFALVGIAFLLLLAIGIFLAMGGRHRDDVHRMQLQSRKNLEERKKEKESAREIVDLLTEALAKYSSAETVEEKLAFVRQPERVGPLMEQYYRKQKMQPYSGAKLVSQYALPIKSHSFVVLTVAFDDTPNRIYLAEVDNDLQIRIDWESDVCYQPVEITNYISERPTEPVNLRVFAQPDNFYVYEFADSAKYMCLKLTFRDNNEILYGYVEKGSPTSKSMAKHFRLALQTGSNKPEPLLLKVRFLETGKSERGVFIEEFIAPRWANIDEFEE